MSTEESKTTDENKEAGKNGNQESASGKNDQENNKNNGGKGVSKGVFIAIAVLALAVIGLLAFIIGDKTKKKDSDNFDISNLLYIYI